MAYNKKQSSSAVRDIEQLIEKAKATRSKILKDNYPFTLRTICWTPVVSALIIMLMVGERPPRQRALEATAQMERLAKNLASTPRIAPDTARIILEILRRPGYNCDNLACGASLAKRNHIARAKLRILLTRTGYSGKVIIANTGSFAQIKSQEPTQCAKCLLDH
jgi:hypothetical protein